MFRHLKHVSVFRAYRMMMISVYIWRNENRNVHDVVRRYNIRSYNTLNIKHKKQQRDLGSQNRKDIVKRTVTGKKEFGRLEVKHEVGDIEVLCRPTI